MTALSTEAALDARAGSALARLVAPRRRDWRAVERLVAAVGGGPTEGVWRR